MTAFASGGSALASGGHDATGVTWAISGIAGLGRIAGKDLGRLWSNLAGGDSSAAYRAMDALVGDPEGFVRFLGERTPRRAALPAPERLARLIADLDSEAFAARQSAMGELGNFGDLIEPTLRKELGRQQASLEVRRRLERLLAEVTDLTAEQLRWLRAIQALELVGNEEATHLLGALARDARTSRVRDDAKAALARIARRSQRDR